MPQPVPIDRFEADQEKFLAYREAVVAYMVRAMGLLSRAALKAELDSADARIQAAEERLAGTPALPSGGLVPEDNAMSRETRLEGRRRTGCS